MAVLIATVVGVALTTTMLTTSVSSTQTTIIEEYSYHARTLTDACVEAGLEQLRVDTNYTGTGLLSIGAGSCEYAVEGSGGSTIVYATGTVDRVVRRVRVELDDLTPAPVVDSWEEVTTF